MATDLSQRLRSALEFGAAVALLMGLTVLAIGRLDSLVARSQVAESLILTGPTKSELVVHRAQTGEWPPAAGDMALKTLGNETEYGAYVDRVELGGGGALTSVFLEDTPAPGLRGRRLTIRPLTLSADSGAPVSWVCGPHRYPSELAPNGTDETDIDPSDLPSACRDY